MATVTLEVTNATTLGLTNVSVVVAVPSGCRGDTIKSIIVNALQAALGENTVVDNPGMVGSEIVSMGEYYSLIDVNGSNSLITVSVQLLSPSLTNVFV